MANPTLTSIHTDITQLSHNLIFEEFLKDLIHALPNQSADIISNRLSQQHVYVNQEQQYIHQLKYLRMTQGQPLDKSECKIITAELLLVRMLLNIRDQELQSIRRA